MERRTSHPKLVRIKSQPERHSNPTMFRDSGVHPHQLTFPGATKVVTDWQRTHKSKTEDKTSRRVSMSSESLDVFGYNLATIIDKDRTKRRKKIAKLHAMASKRDHDADNKQYVSVKSAFSSQVALLNNLRKFSFLTKGREAFYDDVAQSRDQCVPKSVSRRSSVLQMTMHNTGPVISAWPEMKRSNDNESLTNSEMLRELAILKAREKTEAELNLPADRSARMIKLRQNVERIQKKFVTFVREHNRQEHSEAPDDKDLFENEENLLTPSRFAQPGEVLFGEAEL